MNTIEDDVMAKKIADSVSPCSNPSKSPCQEATPVDNEIQNSFITTINFEDTAKQMDELKAMIFSTHETNQTKIQFIKEELSAGRYQIHAHHIAAKLLEHTQLIEYAEIA